MHNPLNDGYVRQYGQDNHDIVEKERYEKADEEEHGAFGAFEEAGLA